MATKTKKMSAQKVPGSDAGGGALRVRGARVHNLKNISVDIPHNQFTVVSGVSGSGKSSLAFDTLYAEGQRRYIESLSAYARQFLERIEKPDVDEITGIAPAIAIRQKNTSRNPRSTVATATEIYDYLRLLFARVGETLCQKCGAKVEKDTVDQICERVLSQPPGSRFHVLFRLSMPEPAKGRKTSARARRETLKGVLSDLRKRGYNRLFQDGKVVEFSSPDSFEALESLLELDFAAPVYVLVDRVTVDQETRSRLVDSAELCYREGDGEVFFHWLGKNGEGISKDVNWWRFSEKFECRDCGIACPEPEPILFSFNSPYGACPRCQGFGNTVDFDLDLIIPDKTRPITQDAVAPWTTPRYRVFQERMKTFCQREGIDPEKSWRSLTAREKKLLLRGEGEGSGDFPGIRGFFDRLERKKYKLHIRVFLSRYRGYSLCPECDGSRLRPEARAVRVGGREIGEVVALDITAAREFFDGLELAPAQATIAGEVLEGIRNRLQYLYEVGLDYLTLDRLTSTLSGGEAQRIQLATSLGSRLVGALYVLDEPSIGLHTRDTGRLIDILKNLRDLGNSILVVEHDPEIIGASDHVIDLGPAAGERGGEVIFAGPRSELEGSGSLTGRYMSGELRVPLPATRRRPGKQWLRVKNCWANNLQGIDIEVPLGMTVVVTGVSGSGKSSLVHDVIARSLVNRVNGGGRKLSGCAAMEGAEAIEDVVLVDQSPIGRTPRSNPATYSKIFDVIRALFARTMDARQAGYGPGHFSFNIPGGRCEVCQGDGSVTVEMQFLADVELVCDDCNGTRYKSGVLGVRFKGLNIHEVLQLTVREAIAFFAGENRIVTKLKVLDQVGLGYLRLGQPATTLSGGEAQRVKLAAHLAREAGADEERSARTLYIFDEPTTGLHFDDIQKLLASFRKLIDAGASVLLIEHNLDVIKTADWIIDLGPEGGDAGGRLVVAGPPEKIAGTKGSHTGRYLKTVLAKAKEEAPSNGSKRGTTKNRGSTKKK